MQTNKAVNRAGSSRPAMSDVPTLRQRARLQIEDGAVTES